MSQQSPISDQFWPLLNAACDDTLLATQVQELEAILSSDAAARRVFADHFQLKTDIRFLGQVTRIRNIGLAGIRATFPPAPPCSCPTPTFGLYHSLYQAWLLFLGLADGISSGNGDYGSWACCHGSHHRISADANYHT